MSKEEGKKNSKPKKRRKRKIKQSETRIIKRSQITLNPINPKRHGADAIKLQRQNLQKVGYLGGIVWNETTGHVIDGHRRIYAMDEYYNYDGTESTDYELKVEVVALDEKTEKEQLTYMAVGNTQADIDLIADYIDEIDYSSVGLSTAEIGEILSMTQVSADAVSEIFDLDITGSLQAEPTVDEAKEEKEEKSYEERKEHMKNVKEQARQKAIEDQLNEEAYLILSFTNYRNKTDFCQMVGVAPESKYAKGEEVLSMIE